MKNDNFKTLIFIFLLIVSVSAVMYYLFAVLQDRSDKDKGPENGDLAVVPVEKRYDGKIVYTTDLDSVDAEAASQDCQERGGRFRECGDICSPGADICAQVCAYTCILPSQDGENSEPLSWREYQDDELGFTMEYPSGTRISEERESSREFIFWGPNQREGTELYDGFRILVFRSGYDQGQTLEEFAHELAEAKPGLDQSIIQDVSKEDDYDYAAYSFTCESLGVYRHLIAMIYPGQAFDISYFLSGEEYLEKVERMLKSFEITDPQRSESEIAGVISVQEPELGESVISPLRVSGQAKGTWFFEASFPIVITNWDGLIIGEGFATTGQNWMSEEMVPFSASVEYEPVGDAYIPKGALILRKANPSGLPENDQALELPVYLE